MVTWYVYSRIRAERIVRLLVAIIIIIVKHADRILDWATLLIVLLKKTQDTQKRFKKWSIPVIITIIIKLSAIIKTSATKSQTKVKLK